MIWMINSMSFNTSGKSMKNLPGFLLRNRNTLLIPANHTLNGNYVI
jgi:hypothetical protein